MTAVVVRDVWKQYGDAVILERVNLSVEGQAFVSLVGPSGCGKTTFLRMLLSQEQPSSGSITIDGDPIAPEPGPDRGVVFQRYSVFPHLSVTDNVILGGEFAQAALTGRLFGAARRRAREEAMETITAVGLDHARDRYPSQLSGGMQQRLAIAQTLVKKPKVLLLDEPFGALDQGTKGTMHDLLLKLWEETGMTVFMVTHDLQEGFYLGTRLVAFDKVRHDPQAPNAYGAVVTFDIPLDAGFQGERKDIEDLLEQGTPNDV